MQHRITKQVFPNALPASQSSKRFHINFKPSCIAQTGNKKSSSITEKHVSECATMHLRSKFTNGFYSCRQPLVHIASMASSCSCGQGQHYEHHEGKVLHLAACTKKIAYSQLKLGWSVVIHTVFCATASQMSRSKIRKLDWIGEWLAFHQILAGNITIIITCLEPLLNSMLFKSWSCRYT